MYIWCSVNSGALDEYCEPEDCVTNDDGTTYDNHKLSDEHCIACHQLSAICDPVKTVIATMEATQKPTSNLVKPFLNKLIDRLENRRSITTFYRGNKEIKLHCL